MEYILIGKIVNTFGIKGELKIDSYSDFEKQRYEKDSFVYVGEEKLPFKVKTHRNHKGFLLVSFVDNEDINKVEKYKNMYIYKNKEDVHKLNEGEYYFSDLKDLDVYVGDRCVGKVLKVEEGIRNNNLRILENNKEVLVPFIKQFVEKVDLDNKSIKIKNIEGLL